MTSALRTLACTLALAGLILSASGVVATTLGGPSKPASDREAQARTAQPLAPAAQAQPHAAQPQAPAAQSRAHAAQSRTLAAQPQAFAAQLRALAAQPLDGPLRGPDSISSRGHDGSVSSRPRVF